MAEYTIAQTFKRVVREFKAQILDSSEHNPLTPNEHLWMDELSKVYLCVELNIDVPETNTPEFKESLNRLAAFGDKSALETRLYIYGNDLVTAEDFAANTPSYLSTIARHHEHWTVRHIESNHTYPDPRDITDFMRNYFNNPEQITKEELTYFLTFYFKHFYKFLHDILLLYTQRESPIYYGRASAHH
jgi:hypothetical protein